MLSLFLSAAFASDLLPHAGEVPVQRLYRRMDDLGGPVKGRWRRRRDAEYLAWELSDETVLRYQLRQRGTVVLDRTFDVQGWPIASVESPRDGIGRVVVHTVPPREMILSGWTSHPIPGGTLRAPVPSIDGGSDRSEFLILGGTLEVWHDPDPGDVYGSDFLDGVLAGCGCLVADRVTAWVDGRPGVRLRLDVAGTAGAYPSLVDLWAVPVSGPDGSGPSGTWFASYTVRNPNHEILSMAPGIAAVAGISLDALDALVPTLEAPP